MKLIIALTISLSFLYGCNTHNEVSSVIASADSLFVDRPDSALTVIRSVDPSQISSDDEMAYYAITYSKILDKNHFDVDNDSLIRIAVDYYDRHGSHTDRALAYYYLGRVYENAYDTKAAVEAFVKAKNTFGTDTLDRTYYLTCSALGNVYADQYMFDGAENMYRMALRGFSRLGEKYNQMAVGIGLGRTLILQSRFDEGLKCNNDVFRLAEEQGDTVMMHVVMAHSINVRLKLDGDGAKAIRSLFSLLNKYGDGKPDPSDYALLSYAYFLTGQLDSARRCGYEYLSAYTDASLSQKLGAYLLLARIEDRVGHLNKVVELKDSILLLKDSIDKLRIETSVLDVEQRYENIQLQNDLTLSNQRNRYQLIIGLLVLVVVLIVLIMMVMARRRAIMLKNREIEEYISAISGLQRSQDNLLSNLNMQVAKERELKELLENRFAQCKELATAYYLHGKSKLLANKIMQLTINDDLLRDLEAMTDLYNGGIVTMLRKEMPSLSDSDINIFVLVTAGFSGQEISAVTGYSLNSVYVRKTRLKQKLDEADIAEKDRIISVFTRKDAV